MAELTDQGYQLKTQQGWYDDEKARYVSIDPSWNLEPSAPDGVKLATDSEIWANLDELGQKAHNSKDPSKASGIELDIIATITGTKRGLGTFSTADVELSGVDGTIIAAGALVESKDAGSIWAIDSDTTILGVTASVVTAVERGAIQASIGAITKIVNPQSGWQTVTNPDVATPGTGTDTDAELRVKRDKGVGLPGQNQIDSTFAAVANIDGVRRVEIYENDSESPVDLNGLPIHSTAIIVDGGVDSDIAAAIYSKRNPGPIQFGASNPVAVDVTSEVTGNVKQIKFNRPDFVDIVVVYTVKSDGTLPGNIRDQLSEATIKYVDGELLEEGAGFNQTGFRIGGEVQSGRLYTPANNVVGESGDSYVTSITVNGGSTVPIGFDQLSRFTDANIAVIVI